MLYYLREIISKDVDWVEFVLKLLQWLVVILTSLELGVPLP
jgi:hypothetical protein